MKSAGFLADMNKAVELMPMLQLMDERTRERFLNEYDVVDDKYAAAFVGSCYAWYERVCRLGIDVTMSYYDVLGESVRALCQEL